LMQREFINIAAHELRTPIQPILGPTEIVKNKTKDGEQKKLPSIVIGNAYRLTNCLSKFWMYQKSKATPLT
jgi:two-component system, OmpR family, sensor histidine kinase VicK